MHNTLRPDLIAFCHELVDRRIHVDRIPEHDKAERRELILLATAMTRAHSASLSMKGDAGELVPTLATIELNVGTASVAFIVDKTQ